MVTLYEYVDIYPTWAYNIAVFVGLIAIFIIFFYIIDNVINESADEFYIGVAVVVATIIIFLLFIEPNIFFGHKFLIVERNSIEDLAEVIKKYNIVEIKDNIVVLVRKALGG